MAPKLRTTYVSRIQDLTPHMRRITLSGDDLINFPTEYESAHVKVLVLNNQESSTKLTFNMNMKKRMRSYTVRKFNIEKSELIIDFAINDHKGLVADWAANAKIGDHIGIGGPGPTKYKGLEADWHLFAGDITAIPVIASTIEKLPEEAIGYAFLQVPSEIDKQIIHTPKGINIIWVINPNPFLNELYSHLEKFKWLKGNPHIMIAGEASQIRNINQMLKQNQQYQQSKTYASGYWKA